MCQRCVFGVRGSVTPKYFKNCKKVGQKVSHAARELATVFSATFFLVAVAGQIVKTPHSPPLSMGSVSAHSDKGRNECHPDPSNSVLEASFTKDKLFTKKIVKKACPERMHFCHIPI